MFTARTPEVDKLTSEVSRKRRRIASACGRCRERKVKCDGIKPTCGACQTHQQVPHDKAPCTYQNELSKSTTEREYIELLQNRIYQLEQLHGQSEVATQALASAPSLLNSSFVEMHLESMGEHGQYSVLMPSSQLDQHPTSSKVLSALTMERSCDNRVPNQDACSDTSPDVPGSMDVVTQPSVMIPKHSHVVESIRPRTDDVISLPGHQPFVQVTPAPLHHEDISPKMATNSQTISESTISAMGAGGAVEARTPISIPEFYGASSAISFFYGIQEALKGNPDDRDAEKNPAYFPPQRRETILSQGFDSYGSAQLQDLYLPPRVLADHLLETYWDNVHCLYPLIHKSSFQLAYEQLWNSLEPGDRLQTSLDVGLGSSQCPTSIFYCGLNAIFALGCTFSNLPLDQKRDFAKTFCRRSLDLALANLLDNSSLALVQALFILGQFLQSTDSPTRCWNVVGLSLRVAQGIGLYVDQASRNCSLLEIEIKRRTWHACLLLDIITGVTLGRPILPAGVTTVPLPAAIDDAYLENEIEDAVQPEYLFSHNSFFLHTLKLYGIFAEVLTHVYKPWQVKDNQHFDGRHKNSVLDTIVDVERDLLSFQANLPLLLRWDNNAEDDGQLWILQRQRSILYTRFLHLKVLLYRPIFYQLYMNRDRDSAIKVAYRDNTITSLLIKHCSRACIESAQELIAHVDRSFQTKAAGAWWYAIFYMFTTGTILILVRMNRGVDESIQQNDILRSWQMCLGILEQLATEHSTARKCHNTLVKLQEQANAAHIGLSTASRHVVEAETTSANGGSAPVFEGVVGTVVDSTADIPEVWQPFDTFQFQDMLWQQPTRQGQFPWDTLNEDWWQNIFSKN